MVNIYFELIKIFCVRKGIYMVELMQRVGTSRQNLNAKGKIKSFAI